MTFQNAAKALNGLKCHFFLYFLWRAFFIRILPTESDINYTLSDARETISKKEAQCNGKII